MARSLAERLRAHEQQKARLAEQEAKLKDAGVVRVYVDGDACPARDEVYRVADRLGLEVLVVSNGSRPIRPPAKPNVRMIIVGEGADVWIADRIEAR